MTQLADRSQTSTGLSIYVYDGLHYVLTLPATFLPAKPSRNVPLSSGRTSQYTEAVHHAFQILS